MLITVTHNAYLTNIFQDTEPSCSDTDLDDVLIGNTYNHLRTDFIQSKDATRRRRSDNDDGIRSQKDVRSASQHTAPAGSRPHQGTSGPSGASPILVREKRDTVSQRRGNQTSLTVSVVINDPSVTKNNGE